MDVNQITKQFISLLDKEPESSKVNSYSISKPGNSKNIREDKKADVEKLKKHNKLKKEKESLKVPKSRKNRDNNTKNESRVTNRQLNLSSGNKTGISHTKESDNHAGPKEKKGKSRQRRKNNKDHPSLINNPNQARLSDQKIVRPMTFNKMKSLLNEELKADVITTLANPRSGFQEMLNDQLLTPDLIMLTVRVLQRVSQSDIHHLKMQILSEAFTPDFIDEIKRCISLTCTENNKQQLTLLKEFFKDTLFLLDDLINLFPSKANEKMKSVMVALNLSMRNANDILLDIDEGLFDKLKDVTDQVNSYVDHKHKLDIKKNSSSNLEMTPNNFRDIPLVPIKDDFICSRGFLRKNIVRGAYSDTEHYLDVQFRLLREDFIAPLREGVQGYVERLVAPCNNRKKYDNIRIYPKVKFLKISKTRDIYGFIINFDCDNKLPKYMKSNWEYNKRFLPNTLLLFSDDNFQTFFLATVAERNVKELEKSCLYIVPIVGTEVPKYVLAPDTFFVMAESEVYYEAYVHVLAALKRINHSNFPMKKYLVEVDTNCAPPAYMVQNSTYEISKFKVDVLGNNWPSPSDLKLNPSQLSALKSALTNEFSVIQGPPGTGKTFLALQIAEVLLKNDVSADTPIVVVCYTNHALDQFLEGILKFSKNVIRIGGRSQSEMLEKYNLGNIRYLHKYNKTDLNYLYTNTKTQKFELKESFNCVENKIDELSCPEGIVDLTQMVSVITPLHYNQLKDHVVDWLLCADAPELYSHQEDTTDDASSSTNTEVDGNHSGSKPENETQPEDFPPNAPDFQELDKIHDLENARRVANLTEGDLIEEEDIKNMDNYSDNLIYVLNLRQLFEIRYDELQKLYEYPLEERNTYEWFYFERDTLEYIQHINWQIDFVRFQFQRLRNLEFSPEKFNYLQNVNIWEMEVNERWEYYMMWIKLYICQLKRGIPVLAKKYRETAMRLEELNQLKDVAFAKQAKVIGLTTSGAAKRRVLMENLNTKIVIVEEAAEVLEAHILTSLSQSVEHVILIGDHKQLRPSPASYKLAKHFQMDVSLFERMLNNGLGCSVLQVQHRMRPEIASLVCPAIYSRLDDHPCTHDRKKISGVDKFVFFLNHTHLEDQLPDITCRQNKHEADFLLALCQYLMNQGYAPTEITILTTYNGQVSYMQKEKRRWVETNPAWKDVRIAAVDNFQGEENRIILLSLVRSNAEARIGFLGTENRVCVALSRARDGLYVIGNMGNLIASSSIWPKIKDQLEMINALGDSLTLRCERHPDQMIHAVSAHDFVAAPKGGCRLMCDTRLPCGHVCPMICHIVDKEHTDVYACKEKCNRPPCSEEGHMCPLKCYEACEPCEIVIKRQLRCGHSAKLRCHVEPASVKCNHRMLVKLPACDHEVVKKCHEDIEKVPCSVKCPMRLPCGHACVKLCHVNDDPDHLKYECRKDCAKANVGCRRNMHPCPKRCYEECGDCMVKMLTDLDCGHRCGVPCSKDGSEVVCNKPCKKTLPCEHKCPLGCSQSCDPKACTVSVDKLGECGHIFKQVPCYKTIELKECKEKCSRKLACGHDCTGKCFEDCTKIFCSLEVDSRVAPACGHPTLKLPCRLNSPDLQAGSDELVELCRVDCREQLPCGHVCSGVCGMCMQGRLHVPCIQQCGKMLICGHVCKANCSELCPPCRTKGCLSACDHRKCDKQHACYLPCKPCNIPCKWSCDHFKCTKRCREECNRPVCDEPCQHTLACGHPCIGFCGEKHPPLCRVCDTDSDVIKANPDGRFVLLTDCGHIVDSQVLCALVVTATSGAVVRPVSCPECDTAIVRTMRCRNVYIRFREQTIMLSRLINEECDRLKRQNAPYVDVLKSSPPTISKSMNNLLIECVKNPKDARNYRQEMAKLVLCCLLYPLVNEGERLKHDLELRNLVDFHRLLLRFEYLAKALRLRMNQLSYMDIKQIELEVARVVRIMSGKAQNLWYDVKKFTWDQDTDLMNEHGFLPLTKISISLKTRDTFKQWYRCDKEHLYVTEDGGSCAACDEIQRTESQVESSQNTSAIPKKPTLEIPTAPLNLPPAAHFKKRKNNKDRGKWQSKPQQEDRPNNHDKGSNITPAALERYNNADSNSNFRGNHQGQNYNFGGDRHYQNEHQFYPPVDTRPAGTAYWTGDMAQAMPRFDKAKNKNKGKCQSQSQQEDRPNNHDKGSNKKPAASNFHVNQQSPYYNFDRDRLYQNEHQFYPPVDTRPGRTAYWTGDMAQAMPRFDKAENKNKGKCQSQSQQEDRPNNRDKGNNIKPATSNFRVNQQSPSYNFDRDRHYQNEHQFYPPVDTRPGGTAYWTGDMAQAMPRFYKEKNKNKRDMYRFDGSERNRQQCMYNNFPLLFGDDEGSPFFSNDPRKEKKNLNHTKKKGCKQNKK